MFEIFKDLKVDWMGIRKPLIAVSVVVLLAGLISAVGRQASPGGTDAFNLGVDFQGGSVITAKFKDGKPSIEQVRSALTTAGLGDSVIQESLDKNDEFLIKIPLLEGEEDLTQKGNSGKNKSEPAKETTEPKAEKETKENSNSTENANASDSNTEGNVNADSSNTASPSNTEENSNTVSSNTEANSNAATISNSGGNSDSKAANKEEEDDNQVSAGRKLVVQALTTFGKEAEPGVQLDQSKDAKFKIVGTDSVGPVAGAQLRNQAVIATLLGMFGILFFIAFRYDWTYAAGAVIAVFHDVLITLAFFTMFQWEVSLTVLAALLTLVGFSVNDSIVIFDRIRENLTLRRDQPLYELVNDSINQTMSRTVVTNGLVFLAVLALVLFGGEVLRGFSLALFVGAITGTYSTIAIASPIAIWWQSKLGEAKMKDATLTKKYNKLASAARGSVKRRPTGE
jgi:preprotein translocase subunit SecF